MVFDDSRGLRALQPRMKTTTEFCPQLCIYTLMGGHIDKGGILFFSPFPLKPMNRRLNPTRPDLVGIFALCI
jgi:hypothetical protein